MLCKGTNLDKEIEEYLAEAAKDAKVLRNINIDFLKKEVEKEPDEEIRDYFARLQQLERENPPIFPVELVNWVEGLDDRYFPRDGRKVFAKWLGNAVWYEEAEERATPGADFSDLAIYNNDIRYIVDYLNGADNVPKEAWSLTFPQMTYAAEEWHEQLSAEIPEVTGDYETKKVVHDFGNGYTMVKVPSGDLEVEGEKMGHCVGGYCDYVESGNTIVYSLRDKKNKPHVTIEVVKIRRERGIDPPVAFEVEQIKGKGNDVPVKKYQPMVKQWIQDNFEPDAYLKSNGVEDYIGLLEKGEIMPLLVSDQLDEWTVTRTLKRTQDEELVDHFLNMKRKWGGPQPALTALMANPGLSLAQAERLVALELLYGFAGSDIKGLFSARSYEGKKFDGEELYGRAWGFAQRYGHKKNSNWIVGYIIEYTKNWDLREEIMNNLFSDAALKEIGRTTSGQYVESGALYRRAIKTYLEKGTHKKETVQKIYDLTRSGTAISKHVYGGGSNDVDRSLAQSGALNHEIINSLIKIEDDYGGYIERALVENPGVPEKYKYGIIQKLFKTRSGSWLNVFGLSIYRSINHGWNEGSYSEKFLNWMVHTGIFDVAIENAAKERFLAEKGFQAKVGIDKEYEKMRLQIKKELTNRITQVSSAAKTWELVPGGKPGNEDLNEAIKIYPATFKPAWHLVREDIKDKFSLFYDTLNLQEDIENYFVKLEK